MLRHMNAHSMTGDTDSDGCRTCLTRRGLIAGALAACGSLAVASPAAAGGKWNTVARQGEIRVGRGKVVRGPEGQSWIVARPAIDAYRAFTAICTHAGCAVAGVVRKRIYCGCHGSKFSIRTGEAVQGPAVRPLERFPVRLRDGQIQVFG
jgi:nitrite reductase/ring-hydroxylating ferredoxin subunit